jgi:ribosomal protein S18 acetylase RimI-like enzyme
VTTAALHLVNRKYYQRRVTHGASRPATTSETQSGCTMNAHLLDRPIWHALRTRQARFALGDDRALRFHADVEPFAASRDDSPDSIAALGALVPPGDLIVLLQAGESPCPPGLIVESTALGVQMVLDTLAQPSASAPIEALGDADTEEMIALAALTKPGPFLARTHELGSFWGVKENGRLIAMAGERMMLEGYTEVSGVCTHPDYRGRGLAALLSHHVAAEILARGEIPMLHAYASNRAAISVYEALGFVLRRHVVVTILRRPAA